MVIDLLILFPVVALSVLGFRDGLVKKGIALTVTFAAMIVAQLTLDDMARFFVDEFDISPGEAPLYGYFTVFFGMIFIQSLVYRLAGHGYKIGGIADRTVGSVFGILQGLLIMSVVLMMLGLLRFPSRTYRVDSRLYKSVVNIAPQLLDFTMNVVPETTGELQEEAKTRVDEFTKPDQKKAAPPQTTQPPKK